MTGKNGGRTNFHGKAENWTFPASDQHAGSGFEIRNRRTTPHPHQVLEANRCLEPQIFRNIRRESGAEVAGAGVDNQTRYLCRFHPGLSQCAACGGNGCAATELEKARQQPVGIGFKDIRTGIYPEIPALDFAVQENAAIQIPFGRFQGEMGEEVFVRLLLRCIKWRGGSTQPSEDDGVHAFSPGLNRMMAAIRNQRAGSTETVTLSSCRNKVLSSSILKPRRIESRASCRTPAHPRYRLGKLRHPAGDGPVGARVWHPPALHLPGNGRPCH